VARGCQFAPTCCRGVRATIAFRCGVNIQRDPTCVRSRIDTIRARSSLRMNRLRTARALDNSPDTEGMATGLPSSCGIRGDGICTRVAHQGEAPSALGLGREEVEPELP
jgi:hypothetical protein